ncbi:hypothetical protein PF007_g2771 [Phytophthora fragariae]|uniref:Uncharacterized protein n=1 Tax=Phytophthora fragariae TaxID=53985 RepID=A0A6A3TG28_9STRA|nr:hypothetical protein PF007_g2771 [Phytophthora fragariae]KAE9153547.1 hypothetical protein PF006_g2318 [Phytophthora fragariae]
MSVASSYEPMCAQQHSDTLLINSAPTQECHDLDFVAHVAAQHLCWCTSTTARVARELAKVDTLAEELLLSCLVACRPETSRSRYFEARSAWCMCAWSHKIFAQPLPATVKCVVVLENVAPSALTFQRGLLT